MSCYICDEDNAIIVVNNPDQTSKNHYLMIHYRVEDEKLVEMNHWEQASHYYENTNAVVLREHHLFMVSGGHGVGCNGYNCCGSVYDYQFGKFVVEKGNFDCIGTTNWVSGSDYALPKKNYLEQHGCLLAYFRVSTKYTAGDIISYTSPVTLEEIHFDFNKQAGLYFALLNTDGTIRDNQLFYGRDFSRTISTIDLNDYDSLAHFKEVKRQELEEIKKQEKEAYYHRLANEEKEFISPYQDEEVVKVLNHRRSQN